MARGGKIPYQGPTLDEALDEMLETPTKEALKAKLAVIEEEMRKVKKHIEFLEQMEADE